VSVILSVRRRCRHTAHLNVNLGSARGRGASAARHEKSAVVFVVFWHVSPVTLVDESCHLWQLGGCSIAAQHHLPVMPATVVIRIHSTSVDALNFLFGSHTRAYYIDVVAREAQHRQENDPTIDHQSQRYRSVGDCVAKFRRVVLDQYKVVARESECKGQHQASRDQKQHEEPVVAPGDAVAYPRAVVVKHFDAVVTVAAVVASGRPVDVTRLTVAPPLNCAVFELVVDDSRSPRQARGFTGNNARITKVATR